MFVRIGNTPRDYAWGSTTAIAALLGSRPSGAPEAELWLGAHPGSPSIVLDPAATGGAGDLAEWIARDPVTALGRADRSAAGGPPGLPYLLKVLAAAGPLSLQAHPSSAQARAGFERENAAGIPLDSAERSYKDPLHKPELIYALSETFEALCGFRAPSESARVLGGFADVSEDAGRAVIQRLSAMLLDAPAERALREATAWLLSGDPVVGGLVSAVVCAAEELGERAQPEQSDHDLSFEVARAVDTVRLLSRAFPGDPGIVLALLLNRATLRRGEVLYLPAGNIHAYLSGLGIELMAASDNVLRGGLTGKRIDVPELLAVLDFAPLHVSTLAPDTSEAGLSVYRPDVPDFALDVVTVGAAVPTTTVRIPGPAIAICTAGEVDLRGVHGSIRLTRGGAVYITLDEERLVASGAGEVFIAVPNG